jgi:putative membrane protein
VRYCLSVAPKTINASMDQKLEMNEITRTDWLALERTKLANERTFLAYFRTFVVVLSSGLAIVKIDLLSSVAMLGYFFIATAIMLLFIGIIRLLQVKKRIRKYFAEDA